MPTICYTTCVLRHPAARVSVDKSYIFNSLYANTDTYASKGKSHGLFVNLGATNPSQYRVILSVSEESRKVSFSIILCPSAGLPLAPTGGELRFRMTPHAVFQRNDELYLTQNRRRTKSCFFARLAQLYLASQEESRLRLRKTQINLLFRLVCTTFAAANTGCQHIQIIN